MRHPLGPFLGAVIFVLLENFAIDFIDRERFNTLIGLCFLAIVLFSPDGVLGLWSRFVAAMRHAGAQNRVLRRAGGDREGFQPAAGGRHISGRR